MYEVFVYVLLTLESVCIIIPVPMCVWYFVKSSVWLVEQTGRIFFTRVCIVCVCVSLCMASVQIHTFL